MSCIVDVKNKKTGVIYVYESESYWDKEKKAPRNRRKLLGIRSETGEIVPTSRTRKQTEPPKDYKALYEASALQIEQLQEQLSQAQDTIKSLQEEKWQMASQLARIKSILND